MTTAKILSPKDLAAKYCRVRSKGELRVESSVCGCTRKIPLPTGESAGLRDDTPSSLESIHNIFPVLRFPFSQYFALSVFSVKVVRHKVGLEAVEKEKQLPFRLVSGTAPVISRASGLF